MVATSAFTSPQTVEDVDRLPQVGRPVPRAGGRSTPPSSRLQEELRALRDRRGDRERLLRERERLDG